MGNIKHSGDCCCFIIYEALVISYINNPWLQSVAGTVIEYSWGIFVENFHHHFKLGHKNKNNPNKNFNCVISQFPPLRNKIFLFLPPTKLFLWGEVVEQNSRVNLEGRFMLDWKEAGTSCIQLYVLSLVLKHVQDASSGDIYCLHGAHANSLSPTWKHFSFQI